MLILSMKSKHLAAAVPLAIVLVLLFVWTAPLPARDRPRTRLYVLVRTTDVRSYGQAGTQIQAIMDVLAMLSGLSAAASQWQLVEPVFMIQPRNSTAYEMALGTAHDHFLGTAAVRWSQWLDLRHLGDFLGYLPLPWEQAASRIDLLLTTTSRCPRGAINFQHKQLYVSQCREVEMGKGLAHWQMLLNTSTAKAIALDLRSGDVFPERIKWRDSHRELWDRVLGAFRFSPDIISTASKHAPPHPYTCVHWRRGDRANAEMSDYGKAYWQRSSPQSLVAQLQGMPRVFVMTNSGNPAERDYLATHARMRALFLQPSVYPAWKDELKRLAVEMQICIDADHFMAIGADYWDSPTPSRLIIDWRHGINVTFMHSS